MDFTTIQSNSKGNFFIVEENGKKLLIDSGINIDKIEKAVNFDFQNIIGCLITHEHKDHAKSVKQLLELGVTVYMSEGTKRALEIEHYRIAIIESKKRVKIENWIVLPFEVNHDAEEPLGFFIQSPEKERLLFAIDTNYIKYKFKNVDIIAVECNHDEKMLDQNVKNGLVPVPLRKRIKMSHMNVDNAVKLIKTNNNKNLREIHLLHLSKQNNDIRPLKEIFMREFGKPIIIKE